MALFFAISIVMIMAVSSAPRTRRAVADALCENPSGVNGINCTSFAECWEGEVRAIKTCQSERGQGKFNPQTNACDWAANVPCDAPQLAGDPLCSQIPQGFEQLAYFVPDPTFCNLYFICAHGNYQGTRNCPWKQVYDEYNQNCTVGGIELCTNGRTILPFRNLH